MASVSYNPKKSGYYNDGSQDNRPSYARGMVSGTLSGQPTNAITNIATNAAKTVANVAKNTAKSVGYTPTSTGFGKPLYNAAGQVADIIRNVAASVGYTPKQPTGDNNPPTNDNPPGNDNPPTNNNNGNTPTYNGNGGGSSGGGTSSSSSSSSSSSPTVRTDMDATVPDNTGAQLFDLYQRYLDDLRNQANTAYNLNMERIRQAYDSNRRTIDDVYSGSQSQLQNAYDKSARGVRDDSEQALRESYINYMMSRKNLGQELSALGLNGGEAETTLGSLLNNYGNSRNAIETTRNKNLSNLGDALQSGLAQAQQNYSSALQSLINNRLNAENAAENARQNLLANFATNLSDLSISNEPYINAIKSLAGTVTGVPITATQATNPYEGTSIRQGGAPFTPASGNPYARFIAQANMMRQGGSSDDDIKNYLFGAVGNDSNALTQIFADLGLV